MPDKQKTGMDESKHYKYIIENIKDVVWEMDENMVFTFVSPTVLQMSGYEVCEVLGKSLFEFLTEDSKVHTQKAKKKFTEELAKGKTKKSFLHDVQFICKDGRTIWTEVSANVSFVKNRVSGFIGSMRDISKKKASEEILNIYINNLEEANEKLEKMATTDLLTGAYNRRKFDEIIHMAIEKKKRYDRPFCLVMFDIDRFKRINDVYGHKTGDDVLKTISSIVTGNIRKTDCLFRWGGEEFIILLFESDLDMGITATEKIQKIIDGYSFGVGWNVTVSLSVAEYHSGEDIDPLIVRLDNSLLQAKSNGRNRYEISEK